MNKGILLAGGNGSRLNPLTKVVSKQLLPVYDKPMIYYPLSTLMLAGARHILIITKAEDSKLFRELLGDGTEFGITLEYAVQAKPQGIAEALIIGEDFLAGEAAFLMLGDNIFHGVGLGAQLKNDLPKNGAKIFVYQVSNPQAYGILELNADGTPKSIEEKPKFPKSNLAITGLYYFDPNAPLIAKQVKPSPRGELEITSVLNLYLQKGHLEITQLSRGTAWLDTGSFETLHDAGAYIRILEERQGLRIGDPLDAAKYNGWL